MLHHKQVDYTNKVVSAKTLSGHEIIGKVVHRDNNVTIIERPQMIIQQMVNGQPSMGIVDFMLSGENAAVEFPTSTLVITVTKDAFVSEYNNIVSQIIQPKNNIIT